MLQKYKTARGAQTRRNILDAAVEFSESRGLGALTFGLLAQELGMSKSGLFAHFGSKSELQLAVLEHAAQVVSRMVFERGDRRDRGIRRLYFLTGAWLEYVAQRSQGGGCLFLATFIDSEKNNSAVQKDVRRRLREWRAALEAESRNAALLGHLRDSESAAQLAFELFAYIQAAHHALYVLGDESAVELAQTALRTRLSRAASEEGLRTGKERRTAPSGPQHLIRDNSAS